MQVLNRKKIKRKRKCEELREDDIGEETEQKMVGERNGKRKDRRGKE